MKVAASLDGTSGDTLLTVVTCSGRRYGAGREFSGMDDASQVDGHVVEGGAAEGVQESPE